MEIFINECSFHEQFFERIDLEQAFKEFYSILITIKDIHEDYKLYNDENFIHIYKAFKDELIVASINNVRDKSFRQAFFEVFKNRLNIADWRNEKVHSSDDLFMCENELVTETSLAELAERAIQNDHLVSTLINFSNSKFSGKLT